MKTRTYAIATAMLFALSTSAFADITPTSSPDMMSLLGRGDFCTTIKAIDTTSLTLPMGTPMQKAMENKKGFMQKVSDVFRNKDNSSETKPGDKPVKIAQTLTDKHTRLRALAKTDAEKSAVETFISATAAAETARTTAMKPITDQIKADTEKLIASKSGLSADAIAQAKTAMESALATAKASCANGTSSVTAKATFQKAMMSNVSVLRDFKPSAELRTELKLLERKNRTAIQSINDTFQDSMDAARDQLELAMPNAQIHKNQNGDNKKGNGQNKPGMGRGQY